ncbi:MAG: tetratricopeptide repeat protein [Myxococcota bacterium]
MRCAPCLLPLLVLVACQGRIADQALSTWSSAGRYARLEVTYPLAGTVFPPDLAPPQFVWADAQGSANAWVVRVTLPGLARPLVHSVRTPQWRPTESEWAAMRHATQVTPGRAIFIGVNADNPTQILSTGGTDWTTSKDPVDGSLFYREVNLPFVRAVADPSQIRWRFGSVASRKPPPIVLTGLPVCGNCHSFSKDGKTLGLDIDYANDKGSYALADTATQIDLTPDRIITWSDFRREDNKPTYGLLSQVSPDGRWVVSTVKDRSVFVPMPNLAFSQLFFPVQGILAVYDRQTRTFAALPGADNPDFVQSNASWSPDGRTLVFARAPKFDLALRHDRALLDPEELAPFLKQGKKFRFDLYTIAFNEGRGGVAQPLAGAANNGKSNYFGRYSPDGRWIAFTQSDSFMLLQPDSLLQLVPAQGGVARRMTCNTRQMNSWHSWSPNGRWLVFSSKANGPYTQLWLTHVDRDGRDAPPVLLDALTQPEHAANIPEFVALPADALRSIRERFADQESYLRAGETARKLGNREDALARYRKVLALDPSNVEGMRTMGAVLAESGRLTEALQVLQRAEQLAPQDGGVQGNLGTVLLQLGKPDQAARHLEAALVQMPDDLGLLEFTALAWMRQQLPERAAPHLRHACELAPQRADLHEKYAKVLGFSGNADAAAEQFRMALRIDPTSVEAQKGLILARQLKSAPP